MKNINLTVRDISNSTATTSFGAQDAAADDGLDTLVDAVTKGVLARRSVTSAITVISSGVPVDPMARNEIGLRLYWVDDVTGRTGYYTVPAPDLDALQVSGDNVNLADAGAMAALKSWLDTNGASPIDGNSVTVTEARVVGRK